MINSIEIVFEPFARSSMEIFVLLLGLSSAILLEWEVVEKREAWPR